ncbi:hypothetical protein DFH06DRAFT_575969 [Mycena polygramma]|nr:hypothetical protein DFH06DRAFT_575969 [Mycena polygramma]
MALDALFMDEALKDYLPFIQRIQRLNETGVITPPTRPRGVRQKTGESFAAITSANTNYLWECILRFLVLDMLLRCKGYKRSAHVPPNGKAIPTRARSLTSKMYKWEKYLADAISHVDPESPSNMPAAKTNLGPQQSHMNLLMTALAIRSFLEETDLPMIGSQVAPFVLSSLSNFETIPAHVRAELPETLTASAANRYICAFLFVSPLSVLIDQDLLSPTIQTSELFDTALALGTMRPLRIDMAEKYVRDVVWNLIADPTLDVPAALAATRGAPRWHPPPYQDAFFYAGALPAYIPLS